MFYSCVLQMINLTVKPTWTYYSRIWKQIEQGKVKTDWRNQRCMSVPHLTLGFYRPSLFFPFIFAHVMANWSSYRVLNCDVFLSKGRGKWMRVSASEMDTKCPNPNYCTDIPVQLFFWQVNMDIATGCPNPSSQQIQEACTDWYT